MRKMGYAPVELERLKARCAFCESLGGDVGDTTAVGEGESDEVLTAARGDPLHGVVRERSAAGEAQRCDATAKRSDKCADGYPRK